MMDLIIGGLFVGIGGAVFSVGVTSLPKYFPKESHGFVNGIYGVGNAEQQLLHFSACYRNFSWLENDSTMLFSFTCSICTYELLLGDRKEKR